MSRILPIWVIAISLVLVSCGGSSKPSTKIDVTMTDFHFQPETFTVPAGQEITFTATNSGGNVHSFVIMNKGYSVRTYFTDEDKPNVYWQVQLPPGGSSDTSFTAPADPGEYEIVCHIPGHIQAGMVGKLNVVASK
jgi:uncharacterized cupredoxin-like copper-binding protein